MNIFGIGLPEMALILVVALLVFGPKKLPEIGKSLAQALNSFKKAQQEFETEFKKEADAIQNSMNTPMKATIERPEPKALSPQSSEETVTQNGTAAAADAVAEETATVQTEQTEAPTEVVSTKPESTVSSTEPPAEDPGETTEEPKNQVA
jgi:sec-independent protein translocase protein TatA